MIKSKIENTSFTSTGRLAPSPTGSLHIGNVRTFLWAWLSIRKAGGRIILRIEDLEKPASQGILENMLSDFKWLGFDWEEGPVWTGEEEIRFRAGQHLDISETGPDGPYIQTQRGGKYSKIFEYLKTRGMIYPCVCSKKDYADVLTAPHEGDMEPRYPGTCRGRFATFEEAARSMKNGKLPVWRFMVPDTGPVHFHDRCFGEQAFDVARTVGDFVTFKTPEQPAYQLAVIADDAEMGVTEVVRGDDLIPSTARQILLLKALEAKIPEYGHVPLVVGMDGKRLAKRHGDVRISTLRRHGASPENIIGKLAEWSGLPVKKPCKPSDLISLWDWNKVESSRVILDSAKLSELSCNKSY
jgi:glutamyl-tRNA synthetase